MCFYWFTSWSAYADTGHGLLAILPFKKSLSSAIVLMTGGVVGLSAAGAHLPQGVDLVLAGLRARNQDPETS